ncbi:MAG: hypothetical protein CVU52_01030 [Deltaproteobacteria bacterium HGW-Deltaproteobacteria-10]|nr:MAG: hypothetical protein CVU52_01030 [Deltaproteobacteria bacterium HGW-Deltaproteobacteria-10]
MLEQGMILTNCREENSCESVFTALMEILRKESDIYQELKDCLINEKRLLIKPNLDELGQNNSAKENIILKARMLEEARVNNLKRIARSLDIRTNVVKLSQIASHAGHEQRKEIELIRDDLALVAREINALNAANKDLLDASMGNIKSSLDFISSIMSSESVYLECGKMKSAHKNGMYLHKEG